MKRSLIAIAAAILSTASQASINTAVSDSTTMDRSLPTYPELGYNDAYRFDAGEPTQELVVLDYGSA